MFRVGEISAQVMLAQCEPTGFPDRESTVIEFDEAARRFGISPTGETFEYWIAGRKYVKGGADNLTISDTEGGHFISYEGSVLVDDSAPPDVNVAQVAYVYWSVAQQKAVVFGDERHGISMSRATQAWVHNTFGIQFVRGLALANFSVDGSGDDDSHAQFGCEGGVIADADLFHYVEALLPYARIPVWYQWGANGEWRVKEADDFPVIYSGTAGYTGGRLAFNSFSGGVHGFTEAGNNDFVLVHVFATNDVRFPVVGILGKEAYSRGGETSGGC